MITADSFTIENGKFILKDKPAFEVTASVLKNVLQNADRNDVQPERGTDYTPVAEDITDTGAKISVQYAYVEDGTSGEHMNAVRLQYQGGGRANPPTLMSSARFTDEEATTIINAIQ